MSLDVNGTTIEVDENGYLLSLEDWSEEVAGKLAEDEEIEMNDQHWEIVNFLRDYYQEFQIAPAVKVLTKAIAKKNDIHKKEASVFLYELFPNGPGLQACKIAGLPKPTGCV
ncbi:MAG: TusE/DsrC/DsvC family sulfur relay protein [SAR324 cluster bacterium]|nr:TusE/DsrC/DsvC family sulfur relay protein [SAR324 cluster bacterium]